MGAGYAPERESKEIKEQSFHFAYKFKSMEQRETPSEEKNALRGGIKPVLMIAASTVSTIGRGITVVATPPNHAGSAHYEIIRDITFRLKGSRENPRFRIQISYIN